MYTSKYQDRPDNCQCGDEVSDVPARVGQEIDCWWDGFIQQNGECGLQPAQLLCIAVFNQILGLWGRLEAAWSQPWQNWRNKTVAEGEGRVGAGYWHHQTVKGKNLIIVESWFVQITL